MAPVENDMHEVHRRRQSVVRYLMIGMIGNADDKRFYAVLRALLRIDSGTFAIARRARLMDLFAQPALASRSSCKSVV
tara:strand:- start:55183 stop:55416 length:234 start_codon:yes stop_codon:yes gene_type:complete